MGTIVVGEGMHGKDYVAPWDKIKQQMKGVFPSTWLCVATHPIFAMMQSLQPGERSLFHI